MPKNIFKPYRKSEAISITQKYFGLKKSTATDLINRLESNCIADVIDGGAIIYSYESNLIAGKTPDIKSEMLSHFAFYRDNPDMIDTEIKRLLTT